MNPTLKLHIEAMDGMNLPSCHYPNKYRLSRILTISKSLQFTPLCIRISPEHGILQESLGCGISATRLGLGWILRQVCPNVLWDELVAPSVRTRIFMFVGQGPSSTRL